MPAWLRDTVCCTGMDSARRGGSGRDTVQWGRDIFSGAERPHSLWNYDAQSDCIIGTLSMLDVGDVGISGHIGSEIEHVSKCNAKMQTHMYPLQMVDSANAFEAEGWCAAAILSVGCGTSRH